MEWLDELFEEFDKGAIIDDATMTRMLRLLDTSTIGLERRNAFEFEITNGIRSDRALELIDIFIQHQLNPITEGVVNGAYSATDIHYQIKRILKSTK